MNKCNCTAGQVVSPAPYNKASACETPAPCGLRTIVIPKVKGSDAKDQPYAPVMGAERNAIVIYEATGAIYVYDLNGVYTNFTGSSITPILEALEKQVADAVATVNSMESDLAGEITNRINADTALQNTINSLQQALNTEVTTRGSDVLALQNALNALQAQVNAMGGGTTEERDERIAADERLQGQITALQTSTEGALKAGDLKTINGQSIVGEGDLELDISGLNIVQTTGDSETEVMSQKAVTEALTAAGQGITSAVLSSNGNNIDLNTSGPTPGASSVELKTVNGNSLIGSGDIEISGGEGSVTMVDTSTPSAPIPLTRIETKVILGNYSPDASHPVGRFSQQFSAAFNAIPTVFASITTPDYVTNGAPETIMKIEVTEITTTSIDLAYWRDNKTAVSDCIITLLIAGH